MEKTRKIICDCGNCLEEKETDFDTVKTKAMVCPKCGFTTLTKKQAEEFARLKELHSIIDKERKIVRVGNSMGFILPDKLTRFGISAGKKIKTEALTANSFVVVLN